MNTPLIRPDAVDPKGQDPEGRKYDQGKDPWHLLPLKPVEMVVKILGFGAKKYAPNNWQRVNDFADRYYSSLQRHLTSYKKHLDGDPDGQLYDEGKGASGLHHLAHAGCCIVFLMWKEHAMGRLDPKTKTHKCAACGWVVRRDDPGVCPGCITGRMEEVR